MEKDQRIRLIKNKINRKILYSKSIGALNSKGKYIIQLDQDDLFIRDDVFDLLYNEAENSSLDLVQISDIVRNQILFDNLTRINCMIPLKNESYITQPELKYTLFTNDYNYLLWCLLIKGDIYKKAIYGLWPVIINYQIKFQEDYIITFMIVILSKNYKYLNYISLIHLFHSNSTSANFIRKNEYHLSLLFCGYIIYDYYIKYNPKDIIILFNYLNFFSKHFKTSKIRFPKLFKHILNIILKSKFLSDKYKIFLKKEFQISDLKHNNSKIIPKLKCINNSTFFNKKVEKNDNKIIFSIIIVCTEYQYLENIIDSIQIQSFIYFEIILIYDNNDIINLNLIKNYIKKYQNIKLISNEEIQGFVYSFSKGIETSKGEYIWLLRPNYILSGKEILSKLYNIVKKDKSIDILEFNLLINDEIVDNNSLNIYKCHHFKSEFNFDGIKYNMNYSEIDLKEDLLINKLIKSNLFKKIINKFNLTNINRKIFNYYNSIFLFAIESEKNIFKSSDIIGVIQKNEDILNNNYYIINNKNQRIQDSIFFINFLFENANNTTKDKEFVLNKFFNIMSIVFNKFNRLSDESLLLYEKFIKCKYISLINKNILKFYYKSLIN
jgi:glycosyltransferase involved in cell wall biosynthesis